MPHARREGLRLALGTLTVVPVRPPESTPTAEVAGWAMLFAPAVGAGIGVAAAVAVRLARLVVGYRATLLPAAVALVVVALLTRGLHLDGLADTADGLGSGRPGPQALEVMGAGNIGPFGIVTLGLCLLLEFTAIVTCIVAERLTHALIVSIVVGRLAGTLACRQGVPAAKPTGLGAMVAGTVPRARAYVLLALVTVQSAAWGAVDNHSGRHGAMRGALAVLLPLALAELLRRHVQRRLGGITGDVLGALVEITVVTSLLVMAIGFTLPRRLP